MAMSTISQSEIDALSPAEWWQTLQQLAEQLAYNRTMLADASARMSRFSVERGTPKTFDTAEAYFEYRHQQAEREKNMRIALDDHEYAFRILARLARKIRKHLSDDADVRFRVIVDGCAHFFGLSPDGTPFLFPVDD